MELYKTSVIPEFIKKPRAWTPNPSLPKNPDATPVEDKICSISLWTFIAVDGVPLIKRAEGGRADAQRRDLFKSVLSRDTSRQMPLIHWVIECARKWGSDLPRDFPSSYMMENSTGMGGAADVEFISALVALARVGLLTVDGPPVSCVTKSDLHVSYLGRFFVRGEEGPGPHLYWPGNNKSGVTMGPGYDIGSRTKDEVEADLTGVGVSQSDAQAVSKGAGLQGADAGKFAAANKKALNLSLEQQDGLFTVLIPKYEKIVCDNMPKSLPSRITQQEFDALCSLAWNLGAYGYTRWNFNRDIHQLNFIQAVPDILSLIGGGPGVPARRARETILLRDGIYHSKPLQ